MNINDYTSTHYGSGNHPFSSGVEPVESGGIHYKLKDLRKERDKLIAARGHNKNRIELCHNQEKIWIDARTRWTHELRAVNQDITQLNKKIRAEMDRLNLKPSGGM